MSASSNSSPEPAPNRVLARLGVLAPVGKVRIFASTVGEVSGLAAFAVIAAEAPPAPEGFVEVAEKSHRRATTLGEVVHEQWVQLPLPPLWQEVAAKLCRATGIAAVVGRRVTYVPVPGLREFYYADTGAIVRSGRWCDRTMDFLMSAGGLGHVPVVGATAASAAVAVAALVWGALAPSAWWWPAVLGLAVVSTVVCAFGERWAQRHYVAEDPREVVLDEVAGMAAALVITGCSPWAVVAAFFAFRFFDIFKVGVHWIEKRKLPGGIVWDDVLAGIYAGVLVLVVGRVVAG